jgi:PAS domain S-box-containing protein
MRVRLLLLICLAIVPALGLALVAGLQYRAMVRDRVYEDLHRLVVLAAADSGETFSDAELFLRSVATLPQARNPDHVAAGVFLATLVSQYPAYLLLAVAARDGNVVTSSLPMPGPVNVSDRTYFRRALDRHTFAVGEYQPGRITHRASINCGYPIFGPTGNVDGVIFVALDPSQLQRPALRVDLPQGSTLTIVDGRGIVLCRYPNPDNWVGRSAADQPLIQAAAGSRHSGVLESIGLDGVRGVYAYSYLSGAASSIKVMIGEPPELAFAQVDTIMYRNLILLLAVALIALLAAGAGARAFILRPVNALVDATRRVGSGDLSARGGLAAEPGELGQLARAFDDMAASLELRQRERELAVDALHREADFISAVLNVADALVTVVDPQGRTVRFNRACERATGYTFEEVRGKPFWEIVILPEERERVMEAFSRLQAGLFPMHERSFLLTKDGGRRLIAWSNTCLLDDKGRVEYIIATGKDVTEQRDFEDKLRLDEGRLQALLTLSEMSAAPLQEIADFAMEAGVKLTRSTIGYLAFMDDDETVLTMHSWSKTAMEECDIIDKPIIYPLETTGLWGEAVRRRKPVITNDYAAPDALKKGYPAGHVHVKRHMNIPVFDGDHIVAVAGVGNKEEPYDESDVMQLRLLMDGMWRLLHRKQAAEALRQAYEELEQRVQERTAELSAANGQLTLEVLERRRAEEMIALQAEELVRSNVELERFAYVASHDLQEPLRKIIAFGDRLKARAGDALTDQATDYLERMQTAAGRMQVLINDLLTYARVTTRAQAFVPVNLNDVTRDVLADLEVLIETSGATVKVGDLPTIHADPVQMRQLLQNVVGNALKFHREGVPPEVLISSELLPLDSPDVSDHADGRRYVRLLFQDNGIGFDEHHLDRVFDVFQRLHSREEYPGTGIGLAVCKKIVDRHGGALTAKSTLGQGSTFLVTLPIGHNEGGTHP